MLLATHNNGVARELLSYGLWSGSHHLHHQLYWISAPKLIIFTLYGSVGTHRLYCYITSHGLSKHWLEMIHSLVSCLSSSTRSGGNCKRNIIYFYFLKFFSNTLSSPLRLTSHNSTIDIETQRLEHRLWNQIRNEKEILLLLCTVC